MTQTELFPELTDESQEAPQSCWRGVPLKDYLYPRQLKIRLKGYAPTLAAMGNLELLNRDLVTVVGTKTSLKENRRASDKGNAVAKDTVKQLVAQGKVIVTGFHYGIDELAARVALSNQGGVIIVLGHGFKNFKAPDWKFSYYANNQRITRHLWNWDQILVLSQFHYAAGWSRDRADRSAVTMAALGEHLIVVEAHDVLGDLQAGLAGLRLGLPVLVPEFGVEEPHNAGNFQLLRQGALPLRKSKATGRINLIIMDQEVPDLTPIVSVMPNFGNLAAGQASLFPYHETPVADWELDAVNA